MDLERSTTEGKRDQESQIEAQELDVEGYRRKQERRPDRRLAGDKQSQQRKAKAAKSLAAIPWFVAAQARPPYAPSHHDDGRALADKID